MLKANIETFLACDASYEEAGIVLYGAPFDSTTSYRPGTRFGSRAIRSESYGLESYSPYQDRDLTDYAVFDAGDQELCFGDASLALKDLRERAAEVAGDGKIPFMLGGEHLVTLAPVQALAEKYRICISSILMHIPICGTIIWARNFPTPVCCAAAGKSWETAGSRSLVSAPATGRNGAGEKNT